MSGLEQPSSSAGRLIGDDAGGVGVVTAVDADRCAGMSHPSRGTGVDVSGTVSADDPAAVSAALTAARDRVCAISTALADLRGLPLWALGQADLLGLARQVEAALRTGYGIQVRLAGEIDQRGLAGMLDARSAAHLLHDALNLTIADARARVAAAQASLPRDNLSGVTIPPAMPELLRGVDAGAFSDRHAKVITDCWAKVPAEVDQHTRAACQAALHEQARMRDANGLRQVADQILLRVDPDGTLTGKDAADRAELHIGRRRRDGLTPYRGLADPLTAEHLQVAIEALSTPKPLDENTPGPRPAPLRRAHAFAEILHRYLTAGAGPKDGGVRPQVVVTIGLDDLLGHPTIHTRPHPRAGRPGQGADCAGNSGTPARGGSGPSTGSGSGSGSGSRRGCGWFDYGGVTDPATARLLACDAAIIPQVLGGESVVLDQGRAMRLFTAAQRRAVTTRDKGCAFPGCDIPPAWCEVHHLIWWSHGGATDISNGVLLCRRHHVLIHQGRWRVDPDPGGGRPRFIPPPHIDPTRKPRRNTHFHLPDLLTTISRQ